MLSSRELDNFTYDISNHAELAAFIAESLGDSPDRARAAIDELERDGYLRASLSAKLRARPDRDHIPRYGRRAGWYAAVRIAKPRLIVETGIHDGLGSAVLLRALERNADEGVEGELASFDIRPETGWLVPEEMRGRWHVEIGDSRSILPHFAAESKIDMFIHDSDHSYEHETFEFEVVLPAASRGAVLVSDNVHGCSAFVDFCRLHRLRPAVFRERPTGHFYPGAGIGLAIVDENGQRGLREK